MKNTPKVLMITFGVIEVGDKLNTYAPVPTTIENFLKNVNRPFPAI